MNDGSAQKSIHDLSRQDLYEQVWATPISSLAKQFGITYSELVKVCKERQIPRPENGYWSKLQFGKTPERPPLPTIAESDAAATAQSTPNTRTSDASPTAPQIEFDADVLQLLARVEALPTIMVPSDLARPHPLVTTTRTGLTDALRRSGKDKAGILWPWFENRKTQHLSISVSEVNIKRALCFMDCLIKELEKLGGKIIFEVPNVYSNQDKQCCVVIAGEKLGELRLREQYKEIKNTKRTDPWASKVDYVLTGNLVLDDGPGPYPKFYCRDTEKSRIEERLNEVLKKLVRTVGEARIRRKRFEEELKHREETERARADLKRQQENERARIDKLLRQADDWQKSEALRAYIQAIEDGIAHGTMRPNNPDEFAAYLKWARDQADRLDPLAASPPSILDKTLE